jgi:hypothetical protein
MCRLRAESARGASTSLLARNDLSVWRRSQTVEPAISRDDVVTIMEVLFDIRTWTHKIRAYLLGDDEEEENT